jgi:hypothetical protein
MLSLPANWKDIQPNQVYQTSREKLVAFSKTQIELGKKYDPNNKHLKAIEKGEVPPRGNMGLVLSEQKGYYLKSKVLGKGGDYRFHAQLIKLNEQENNEQKNNEEQNNEQASLILYFPGLMTEH